MQKARQPNQGIHQQTMWEKHSSLTMKCNVDCALFNKNTITGPDIRFRDSSGALLLSFLKYSYFNYFPVEVEA